MMMVKKIALQRYGNPKKYLLDIKKEKENTYYIKEETQGTNGNIQREYAYFQVTLWSGW